MNKQYNPSVIPGVYNLEIYRTESARGVQFAARFATTLDEAEARRRVDSYLVLIATASVQADVDEAAAMRLADRLN